MCHHIAIPPAIARARLIPSIGFGVLDRAAQTLALGVRDAEQRFAVDAQRLPPGRRSLADSRPAPSDCTFALCASWLPPTSSGEPLRRSRRPRRSAPGGAAARPQDELELLPMADGGEGTLDALVAAEGRADTQWLGSAARWAIRSTLRWGCWKTPAGSQRSSSPPLASGLALISEVRRDPLRATSTGTGDLIHAALERKGRSHRRMPRRKRGQRRGQRHGRRARRPLPQRGGDRPASRAARAIRLERIASTRHLIPAFVEPKSSAPPTSTTSYRPVRCQRRLRSSEGRRSRAGCLLLDRALGHLAAIVHRDFGVSPHETPGSGAAGGLGFGLLAFCGARLRPGVEVVMQACGFQDRLIAADLVITGEGSFDAQSLRGKVPAGIMREAGIAGVSVVIVCGRAEVSPPGATVVSLVDQVGESVAMQDARASLVSVTEELAARAEELVPGIARE